MKKTLFLLLIVALLCSCASTQFPDNADYTKTDLWEVSRYDSTREPFISNSALGRFSNTATAGDDMTAYICYDGQQLYAKFLEYNSSWANNAVMQGYDLFIYRGEERALITTVKCAGNAFPLNAKVFAELCKGGVLEFQFDGWGTVASNYSFTMDVTGFAHAAKTLFGTQDR